MKNFVRMVTVGAALIVAATTAHAQGVAPANRQARREAIKQRVQSLTPEQRAVLKTRRVAVRQERRALGRQVRAGTITRAQARMQFRQRQRKNVRAKVQ